MFSSGSFFSLVCFISSVGMNVHQRNSSSSSRIILLSIIFHVYTIFSVFIQNDKKSLEKLSFSSKWDFLHLLTIVCLDRILCILVWIGWDLCDASRPLLSHRFDAKSISIVVALRQPQKFHRTIEWNFSCEIPRFRTHRVTFCFWELAHFSLY